MLKLNFDADARFQRPDLIEYWNDFTKPTDYATADWTLTTVETGTATEAIGNLAGGILVVTNGTADDDSDFFQLAKETFKWVTGKKMYMGMRFKIDDVTQSDFVFGLQLTDTTPLAVTDGMWFGKDDGDALLDFHSAKNSGQTNVTGVATLVNDTYVTIEAYYDGGNEWELYVNGVGAGSCALTNVCDDEDLTVSFGIQNGVVTLSRVLSVDWIRVLSER